MTRFNSRAITSMTTEQVLAVADAASTTVVSATVMLTMLATVTQPAYLHTTSTPFDVACQRVSSVVRASAHGKKRGGGGGKRRSTFVERGAGGTATL